jgi:ribonuclease G
MASTLIINHRDYETRVAVMENGVLVEVYIERKSNSMSQGNIYKGTVLKVLPGMQSAFVDIGSEKAAFLYVDDIYIKNDDVDYSQKSKTNISDILKEQQSIIVQISKEPIGTKGPKVTTDISLPGRYLVLTPLTLASGVSKKNR